MKPGPDIEQRTMDYTVRAVSLFRYLKSTRDEAASILGRQYLRSAASIGANLVEARAGESKADFIHKCAIAQKEARESLYWLRIMLRAQLVSSRRIQPLLDETDELIAIITAILKNTKRQT
jgi:four helix bundle protein